MMNFVKNEDKLVYSTEEVELRNSLEEEIERIEFEIRADEYEITLYEEDDPRYRDYEREIKKLKASLKDARQRWLSRFGWAAA